MQVGNIKPTANISGVRYGFARVGQMLRDSVRGAGNTTVGKEIGDVAGEVGKSRTSPRKSRTACGGGSLVDLARNKLRTLRRR